jgi:ribosome-binding factor A
MIASTIQKELAMIIMRELTDPRLTGMPSITRVKVSEDLATADVFVTVMGTPGQQTAALNALKHSAGLMRTRLTKQMTLRIAPFLNFKIDEDLKKELALQELLQKVREENEELDRKRAAEAAAAAPEGEAPGADASGVGVDGPAASNAEAGSEKANPDHAPPAEAQKGDASLDAGAP